MRIRPVPCGRTVTTQLIVALRIFANASNNWLLWYLDDDENIFSSYRRSKMKVDASNLKNIHIIFRKYELFNC
jgi:hypothetical protein